MSHKFRSEQTKIKRWCGLRADARVKPGRDTLQSRASREVRTSADIPERSRKFVRHAG